MWVQQVTTMIKTPFLQFSQIERYLKLSKSEATDNGPYTLTKDFEHDWITIHDRNGQAVGQITGEQAMEIGRGA